MVNNDELMNDLGFSSFSSIPQSEDIPVYFQFDEDEPVELARCTGENPTFALRLEKGSSVPNEPSLVFSDGKGKTFKLFMK